jgi:hypothetical protein
MELAGPLVSLISASTMRDEARFRVNLIVMHGSLKACS